MLGWAWKHVVSSKYQRNVNQESHKDKQHMSKISSSSCGGDAIVVHREKLKYWQWGSAARSAVHSSLRRWEDGKTSYCRTTIKFS